MIDGLDLAYDDERMEKGRHRRNAQRKRNKKRRGGGRGKTMTALLMALVLLGTLAGGVWYGFDRIQSFLVTPDYNGLGTDEVLIEVKAGESATEIANTLVIADVVKSAKAFVEVAQADVRSQGIQPGRYKVRKQMAAKSALALLLDLKNKVSNAFTVPEGRSAKQTFRLLEKATKIPVKEFEAAAKDPLALGVPDWWFKRSDGKKITPSVEGFLFPDTYEMHPDATAESVLREMVQTFLTVTGKMNFADRVQAERGGISPYEVLIVASLAQAEAGTVGDLGKVARVAYNRVYSGTFDCGCLEMDVTVNYWLEVNNRPTKASKDMTREELNDPKNPYNRKLRGLPPTPINNPGKQAIEGAMDPPKGKWLYFVAIDKKGTSAFADTYSEHQRNEAIARKNGVI